MQEMRCRFDPWFRKIPWCRAWQPTPVFLSVESVYRGAWWVMVHWVSKVKHGWSDLAHTHTGFAYIKKRNHWQDCKFWILPNFLPPKNQWAGPKVINQLHCESRPPPSFPNYQVSLFKGVRNMHYKGLKKKKKTLIERVHWIWAQPEFYIFTKNQNTNYFLNPGIMISEWQ